MIRAPRIAGALRLAVVAVGMVLLWMLVVGLFLPFDNPLILFLRFNTHRLANLFRSAASRDAWVSQTPRFPVDLSHDVALVIKTGYGTLDRLPAQLDALGLVSRPGEVSRRAGSCDFLAENVVIIGDFEAHLDRRPNENEVKVEDMVADTIASKSLAGMEEADRVQKYRNMTALIKAGRQAEAQEAGKSFGWELDAMKFISGLERLYRRLPNKKWYIMLDDDSFLIKPSLRLLLGHVDPSEPAYLGNAIGDYKGRFAHGGSAFMLSHAAMARLFDDHPEVVHAAHLGALTETWGDKLVATTFMKVGVYLDERYGHHFNGEPPLITKIQEDRFCSLLVSFHSLARPGQMLALGEVFRDRAKPVFWHQLWTIYGLPDMKDFVRHPIRPRSDHVGRTDEHTMTSRGVGSADDCRKICERHHRTCLAWTWEQAGSACHISPWIIIGETAEGKYSGLNVPRVKMLQEKCSSQHP